MMLRPAANATLPRSREASITWVRELKEGSAVVFRFGRSGGRLVGEWPGLARLTCGPDGSRPRLVAHARAARGALAKLQGTVRVMLGDLRGGLGIHASAVAMGSSAVLLLGDTGAGKSTGAAELCLQHGGRLLADDAALVELRDNRVVVVPSEDSFCLSHESRKTLRLARASGTLRYGTKSLIRPEAIARQSPTLRLVVVLRFDDRVRRVEQRRLIGGSAAAIVLGSLYRFDVGDAAARRRELDTVMRMYEQAPFLEIVRPRSAPGVMGLVVDALRYDDGKHGGSSER